MFSKWTIFSILLALAESSTNATSLQGHDITHEFNKLLFDVIRPSGWSSLYDSVRNNTNDAYTKELNIKDVHFQNDIHFHNVTLKFQSTPSLKIRLAYLSDKNITHVICKMFSASFKGYLNNTNNYTYIATEIYPFSFTFRIPATVKSIEDHENLTITDFHNLNEYNIELKTDGYQYKPNEKDQIKRELKTYLKTILNENSTRQWKINFYNLGYSFMRPLFEETLKDQNYYYFIENIPAKDHYTMSNITIKGLRNFTDILLDFSTSAAFPEMEIDGVSGTMVLHRFFHEVKKSSNFWFEVDNIYISANRETGGINTEIGSCRIRNTKMDGLQIYEGEGRAFAQTIVSAIGAQVKVARKDIPF